MLLSTHAFLKSISNVSGKDIGPLIKQWVYPVLAPDALRVLALQSETENRVFCRLSFTLDSANVPNAASNGSFSGFLKVQSFGYFRHW